VLQERFADTSDGPRSGDANIVPDSAECKRLLEYVSTKTIEHTT
jgi:hypothetical protein